MLHFHNWLKQRRQSGGQDFLADTAATVTDTTGKTTALATMKMALMVTTTKVTEDATTPSITLPTTIAMTRTP